MARFLVVLFLAVSCCWAFLGCGDEDDCTPNDHTICREGVTYWVDSCGNEGNKAGDCDCGCNADFSGCREQCDCEPDCSRKCCGDDGCGGICTDNCAATGQTCNGASCLCEGDCTPNCNNRVCGDDGCGGNCEPGCGHGETCNAQGQCEGGSCSGEVSSITGLFATDVADVQFDTVVVGLSHKRDIDEYEDGCITRIEIALTYGSGCQLQVVTDSRYVWQGGLAVQSVEFSADSFCPNFPDPTEGTYTDTGGMVLAEIVPGVTEVPGYNVPEICVATTLTIRLEGVLARGGDGAELAALQTEIVIGGEFLSFGDTMASCPCLPDCSGKECGGDGCGGLCGTCLGMSTCDDSGGTAICVCDAGYTGVECDTCATGYQDNDGDGTCLPDCSAQECSDHGACDDSSGEAMCYCDTGYAGAACDICDAGYQDNDGDGTCLPDCSAQDCSGHGACDDSGGTAICVCDAGYAGAACDTCDVGYQDNNGDGTCLPDCSAQDCSGHGTCDDVSGEAVCTCDDGWGGLGCSVEVVGIEWVAIPGGTFMMGSDTGSSNEQPVHQVTVPAFEMNRTEVTVAQYQACVDSGVCTEADDYTVSSYCNWGQAGREDHPVNCVDWFQVVDFCSWMGGRLPSEAEWEYAARGGGQEITYPWGEDSPSCTYAVMNEGGSGCGMNRTWSVCSKTAGNTAQGLCDMAGNLWEWVQDWYHNTYDGAPSDGGAWETPGGSNRVSRGGSFGSGVGFGLRASNRNYCGPSVRYGYIGFRCAR